MGSPRRFSVSKVDDNQSEVVATFRRFGFSVQPAHTMGGGMTDLIVGYGDWFTFLVEVKDGAKPPSKRKFTPDQLEWHKAWRGGSYKVETIDDVVKLSLAVRVFVDMVVRTGIAVDYPRISV